MEKRRGPSSVGGSLSRRKLDQDAVLPRPSSRARLLTACLPLGLGRDNWTLDMVMDMGFVVTVLQFPLADSFPSSPADRDGPQYSGAHTYRVCINDQSIAVYSSLPLVLVGRKSLAHFPSVRRMYDANLDC